MVLENISRALSIHCYTPKPEIYIAVSKNKTAGTSARSNNNNKKSRKKGKHFMYAPETAKGTLLTQMREAGYMYVLNKHFY